MHKRENFPIAKIYVPVKRRATLRPEAVREILEIGQETPILVRRDGDRFVLVEGLHRLEACKALGEETIIGFLVLGRSNKAPSPYDGEADAIREKMERLRTLRLAKEAEEKVALLPMWSLRRPQRAAQKNRADPVTSPRAPNPQLWRTG